MLAAIEGEIVRLAPAAARRRASPSHRFTPLAGARPTARKRALSPEARGKIAAAQARRWARERASKPPA